MLEMNRKYFCLVNSFYYFHPFKYTGYLRIRIKVIKLTLTYKVSLKNKQLILPVDLSLKGGCTFSLCYFLLNIEAHGPHSLFQFLRDILDTNRTKVFLNERE